MGTVALGAGFVAATPAQKEASPRTLSPDTVTNFVADYCLMCHSDAAKTGGLTLESFDAAHVADDAEVAEKMNRKLRLGMMPPAIAPQPERETVDALVTTLATQIDTAAAEQRIPAGVRSGDSTAPSTRARCATCSASKST